MTHDSTLRDAIGLRDEDLSSEEQDALAALLRDDREAASEAEEASALGETLAGLPPVDAGPSAADILARAREPAPEANRPSGWWRWAGAVAAIAAAGLVFVLASSDGMRARGVATSDAFVRIEAVADGAQVRALKDGASLEGTESVVFYVTTGAEGSVTLTERGPGGEREILAWTASEGRHPLGGGQPLAWRPESGAGAYQFTVRWCPPGGPGAGGVSCVQDTLPLHWR